MSIQKRDGAIAEAPTRHSLSEDRRRIYRVEVSAALLDVWVSLIDWLIGFVFDVLGADHLDVRVHSTKR